MEIRSSLNRQERHSRTLTNHPPFSTILKLLILTGQRRSQIWKLQPHWIEDDLITFPRERPANVFW
jgi:integrase